MITVFFTTFEFSSLDVLIANIVKQLLIIVHGNSPPVVWEWSHIYYMAGGAGEQLEVEIYPQFKNMDEVPKDGQTEKRDNSQAQKNLNDKNARKYVERLINHNFHDDDLWITLTYDDEHLPPDGDIDAAIKNMQGFIRRVNYRRKKAGLPNCKYVYVTEYNEDAEIRWHHHLVMDGALDMDSVEKCWKQGRRNEVRRLKKDENGLSGMANYIVKEKKRVKSEKRWNSSKGLVNPDVRVVHSKQPEKGKGNYKKIRSYVEEMTKRCPVCS